MRDANRINEVLEVLRKYWNKVPDWRLGQLFCNLQRMANNDLFYYEDDQLVHLIEEFFKNCD